MQSGYEVGAVVHGDHRLKVKGRVDMPVIDLVVFSFDGKDGNIQILNQKSGHIILSAQWIGSTQPQLGTAGFQSLHQGCGFSGHMQASSKTNAL